ncbi:TetR/AcrR family transcriptional regulator [Mycobacterium sp. OAE908]|uniref:TetR/AcrR family transcriptional regulator n=1 Tax=Mycobacterium sp. OAE908 TaxID=2817899 RepID=UPI001AE80063
MAAETRQRIVEATEKCFGLYGYDKTTIKDIADEAGLTTGALYHYFDSKQDLFAAVFAGCRDQLVGSFIKAAETADTAVGKLCAILDRAVQMNIEDEHIARFISAADIEIGRHPELAELLRDLPKEPDVLSFYKGIVRQGIKRGELSPDTDVQGLVDMINAVTLGFSQFAAYHSNVRAHKRAIETFKLLLQGQLFQPAAGRSTARRRRTG